MVTEVQRRPLIEWARLFAKSGRWADVRGRRLWSRKEGDPPQLRVAFRVELFAQAHVMELARMTPRHFGELCVLYGVGRPVRVQGGDKRAVELADEFVADLLAMPLTEEANPGAAGGRPGCPRPCAPRSGRWASTRSPSACTSSTRNGNRRPRRK
jgi:hypothetical protein